MSKTTQTEIRTTETENKGLSAPQLIGIALLTVGTFLVFIYSVSP